jgi:hypothetical protein
MSFSTPHLIPLKASVQSEKPCATKTRLLSNWARAGAVLLVMALIGSLVVLPGRALAEEASSGYDNSEGTGIQVASWALTVPYVIAKGAFALGGAVVGGLGYVFSGGNSNTAKTVWTRSMYGTYVIRPAHLRGEEPVHFLGHAEENQSEVTPLPAQPKPESAKPEKK